MSWRSLCVCVCLWPSVGMRGTVCSVLVRAGRAAISRSLCCHAQQKKNVWVNHVTYGGHGQIERLDGLMPLSNTWEWPRAAGPRELGVCVAALFLWQRRITLDKGTRTALRKRYVDRQGQAARPSAAGTCGMLETAAPAHLLSLLLLRDSLRVLSFSRSLH